MAKNYKMKTNKSAKKRMKITKSGKVRRYRAGRSHLLSKKSGKKHRNMRRTTLVDKAQEATCLRLLGHG